MKRDMDLIRLLLLEIEDEETVDISAYTDEQKRYHLALLVEANLLEGNVHYSSRKQSDIPDIVRIKRITWGGHEFLDKARSVAVWTKAKEIIKKTGATVSMQALLIALEKAVDAIVS